MMNKNNDITNLLLVELSLQVSAIKSILIKTGIATEKEILDEVKSIESKMLEAASVLSGKEIPLVKNKDQN